MTAVVVKLAVLWGWSSVMVLFGYVIGRGKRDRWQLHSPSNVVQFDRRVEDRYRGRAS